MYDALRVKPPFSRWKLPPGDEVRFTTRAAVSIERRLGIGPADLLLGYHYLELDGGHVIGVVAKNTATRARAKATLAHEMIHASLAINAAKSGAVYSPGHGRAFQSRRRMVAIALGCEPEEI